MVVTLGERLYRTTYEAMGDYCSRITGKYTAEAQEAATRGMITKPGPATRRCWRLQLANASVRRAELTESETELTRVNDQAIRRTLEAAGVEFIDANGGGPGVRLRPAQQTG